MSSAKTISVPHLGGIEAGYYIPTPYIATKPTVILVNPFVTSVDLFNPQFSNKALTSALNLVAIEMLGHGKTQAKAEHYTYWDTALMNLQAMDALGIEKAFVLGVSQGGWVTVRMALLAPERIQGVIPVGTSMDFESSPRTLELGCWDGVGMCSPLIDEWTRTHPVSDEWGPGEEFCDDIGDNGFGKDRNLYQSEREFLKGIIRENYKGDEGRRRARMCTVNLRDRDGLRGRLWDVKCPVLWMQGTEDIVFSVANAKEEIAMFANSVDASLVVIDGGPHQLSLSHPKEVASRLLEFVGKWRKGFDR